MAIQHHQYDDDQTNGLIISIVPALSKRIKKAAAQSNLSVQDYVDHILDQTVPTETDAEEKHTEGLNRAAVEKLLRTREEIMHAHPGFVFEDSVETLRQIREERIRELEQR